MEKVIAAGSSWLEADAEDDDQYERRLASFTRACEAWLRSRAWTPPTAANDNLER